MNGKLSLCMPFYENQGILRLHLDEWSSWPAEVRDRFRFVIVDDASPKSPAEPVLRSYQEFPGEVWLFRVREDKPWAWDAARNIAMHNVPDGWCLITDIDHVLPLASARVLPEASLDEGSYYVPHRRRAVDDRPYKPHPNSYLLTREMYWRAGGYDEQFVGWYGKDRAFRRQLQMVGRADSLPGLELKLYGREVQPDASTTTYSRKDGPYYTCNDPEVRAAVNRTHVVGVQKSMTMPYDRLM